MEIVRRLRREIRRAERRDGLGFDVDHAGDILHPARDAEGRFLRDGESVLLEKFRIHDGVGDAGFILEAHKHHALRGARSLAADH